MTDVKVESSVAAADGDVQDTVKETSARSNNRKNRGPKFDEAALEKEFKVFVEKLRKQFGAASLATQISSHPEVSESFIILGWIKI